MPDISDTVKEEIAQFPKPQPANSPNSSPYIVFSYDTDGTQVTAVHLARRMEMSGIQVYARESGIRHDGPEWMDPKKLEPQKGVLKSIEAFFREIYSSIF